MSDGLWLLITRKGQAFVPTMARTEVGFYMGVEPVEVIDMSDPERVEQALVRAVMRGNPEVPTPTRGDFPEDPLLKHANVKSMATFERSAHSWKVSKQGANYVIGPYRLGKYGGSEEDQQKMEAIPAEKGIEAVVHRLVHRALNGA